MMVLQTRLSFGSAFLAYLLCQAAQAASFSGLGDLPGGSFDSIAFGISADGSVVVGRSFISTNGTEAFRWTSGTGMVGLGDLPGGEFTSEAKGSSADGSVVAGFRFSTSTRLTEAFRWTSGTGMVGIGDLPGGQFDSAATGISADGSVVVGNSISASGSEAFRWTSSEGMVGLGDLPGGNFNSGALGISADGTAVVGQGKSAIDSEAFRWTSGTGMVALGDLPGGSFGSAAISASADGSVVVGFGSSANGMEAFRWTSNTGMVGLGDLPGGAFVSEALATSADGSVVVGRSNAAGGFGAFRWDAVNGMVSVQSLLTAGGVDLTGWILTSALGISANGLVIVGHGLNPQRVTEAWIASFVGPLAVPIDIDIKPGSGPNNINPKSGGFVRVAILTTEGFDAQSVDQSSIEFGPSGAIPLETFVHFDDTNNDELADLILRFRIPETGIECGDESASLTGLTFDGQEIEGSDSIKTVGCK